jgi:hypothetical protein
MKPYSLGDTDEVEVSKAQAIIELSNAFSEESTQEAPAQTALEKYWWLLLLDPSRHPHHSQGVYTQVPIGLGDKEYVPDFLVLHDIRAFTALSTWRAIELEPPGATLLNRDGRLSKRLRIAYEQVLDWDEWLSRHAGARNDLFWADNRIGYEFHVYVGRRATADERVQGKIGALNRANRQIRLSFHTYDHLLERAASMDEGTWGWYERSARPVFVADDFRAKKSWSYDRTADSIVVRGGW